MRLFCLLCIPLLYLLKRFVLPSGEGSSRSSDVSRADGLGSGFLALVLGSVMTVLQYFLSPLVEPGGFGFSRWISGFVDIISLPVLIPLAVCLVLVTFKVFSSGIEYANFTLLGLIPLAAFRSVTTVSPPSPIQLVLVPLLWIAQTMGIAFFISYLVRKLRWYAVVPLALGIAALPLAAVTSWWAFFSLQTPMGFLFLALTLIPAALSLLFGYFPIGKGRTPSIDERPESDMISRSSPIATPDESGN